MMVYSVTKYPGKGWYIVNQYGTRQGPYKTRKEAVTVARVLAGWRGKVVVG
jgi:hypothetical protein